MKIAVPKEVMEGERRVALVPDVVKRLIDSGFSLSVEAGAGESARFEDSVFEAAGATIVSGAESLWGGADLVVKINRPTDREIGYARKGSSLIALIMPLVNLDVARKLADAGVTSFSLDQLPRITRAQSMDVLSSMSTVAGYKAVLMAAVESGRFFPMLVTAAGTLAPTRALVLGAGVAGLQAIATARRLGAIVEAFDVRPVVKEQVESLGATFIAPEAGGEEDEGGYARKQSEEKQQRDLELIAEHAKKTHVIITTALIPGRPAPLLITREAVEGMPAGAVIVDLAAEAGGNCELTEPGKNVVHKGVTIMGPLNLPASTPIHASQMFAKNVMTLINHLVEDGELKLDFEDEITVGTCITHAGKVVQEATRKAMEESTDA